MLQVLRKQITAEQPRHETQQQIDAVNRDIDNIKAEIRRQQLTYEVGSAACWCIWCKGWGPLFSQVLAFCACML
jgi:hypothetical protein